MCQQLQVNPDTNILKVTNFKLKRNVRIVELKIDNRDKKAP